jgi:hypothetical protein
MAQRQRRAETENRTQAGEQLIHQADDLLNKLRVTQMTPAQMEQMRRFVEEMSKLLQSGPQTQTEPSRTKPASPSYGQVPAPRRVQQFVYDVRVSGTTYRLTLGERLPTDRQGNVDVAVARRRLHEALLHNEPAPLGGHMSASVHMTGHSQEASRFNAGPENQRMDIFRDRYVAQTYREGEYVDNSSITIAQVQSQKPRGG